MTPSAYLPARARDSQAAWQLPLHTDRRLGHRPRAYLAQAAPASVALQLDRD